MAREVILSPVQPVYSEREERKFHEEETEVRPMIWSPVDCCVLYFLTEKITPQPQKKI